ncbi:MAG: FAD-dependent oxidoreductase [Deltaproteobacteria bacterium]|nr:FAD-dependent oxidoreductase [Deltaproteobacteria bacterium]
MSGYDYDLAVIGGGAAGLTVASGAARLGAKTLLIEKEQVLGGDCLHYGCVPSKTLIKSAYVYHLMKNGRQFGLPEIVLPPVDFMAITERIRSVIAVIQKHDSLERFCRLGVKVLFGEPQFSDEHRVIVGGKAISARTWVLATGSSAAVPALAGLDETPYLSNRDLFSLPKLPASLIILGAGPIAVEMAQAFCRLGSKVTVVQRSGQILSNEDQDMAALVQQVMAVEGVDFQMHSSIVRVEDRGHEREVVLKNREGEIVRLRAEALLVAMGRSPNVAGLGLEKIGVDYDHKGIKVNRYLKTNHKHIYAAGDVIGGYQFTHVAGYEGGVVLSNAIFHLPKKTNYTYVPWCTYTHPELAGIGLNEKTATAAGIDYAVWSEEFNANDRALSAGESAGRIKLLLDRKERPLGVQILGPHAGDLLSEWVAILNGKVGLAKVVSAIHPYPTLAEINKKVAGLVFAEKIFSERVQKGLKFFFSFKGRACACGQDMECG